MGRTQSSHRWLREHFTDPYVKKAQAMGMRSRAAFKLMELNERDKLFKPKMTVIDLGAAPGGWSQVVQQYLEDRGSIIATDILPMDPLPNVQFIQGDFTERDIYNALKTALNGKLADLVLSDMAPNTSGNKAIDQPRAMYLAELAYECTQSLLKPKGNFLVKTFQGEGFDEYLKMLKNGFEKVFIRKPEASRARSREIYLLGRGKKNS